MFVLEFSFDRSSASTQTTQQNQSDPIDNGIDTSTIANERLRKAIERNRAKQMERDRIQNQTRQQSQQASFLDKEQQEPPLKSHAEERIHQGAPKIAVMATRKSVARADEVDFTPAKRTPRKVAAQISYTTTSRKKSKPIDPVIVARFIKGCWIFCAIMIFRLIFADGGVTDYYSQRSLYENRLAELDKIKKENMQLVREIEKMQMDISFQKKLVRDNLGFIAADEFLVLFPKENSNQ